MPANAPHRWLRCRRSTWALPCQPMPGCASSAVTRRAGLIQPARRCQQAVATTGNCASSLSGFGTVGCECAAAAHFLPSSCPIVPLWGGESGKNWPRWGAFSLSTPKVRQAASCSVSALARRLQSAPGPLSHSGGRPGLPSTRCSSTPLHCQSTPARSKPCACSICACSSTMRTPLRDRRESTLSSGETCGANTPAGRADAPAAGASA
jgi:hypothetical protein